MPWVEMVSPASPRFGRCDYCGRQQVLIETELRRSGTAFTAFGCSKCDSDSYSRIPLELVQWARGRTDGLVEWRQIDEADLVGTLHQDKLRARVGDAPLLKVASWSGGDEAASLYVGTFKSPLEQKTVLFWSKVSLP